MRKGCSGECRECLSSTFCIAGELCRDRGSYDA